MSKFLLFISFILLICSNGYAATISVNTKTEFTNGINSVNPGDTVFIESGTYTNWGVVTIGSSKNCTQSLPCRITASSLGSVIFSGQNALSLDIRGAFWIISNIQFNNPVLSGGCCLSTATGSLITFDGAQDVIVENVLMNNVTGNGVAIPVIKLNGTKDTLRNTFRNSTVNGFSPTDGYIFYIYGRSERGFVTNFNIIGNLFKNRTTPATSGGKYWIRYGNGNLSGYLTPQNAIATPRNSALLIQGNTFLDDTVGSNGHDVMHMKGSGITVKDNIFQNVTRLAFRLGQNIKLINNKFIRPNTTKTDHTVFIADSNQLIANNVFVSSNSKRGIELAEGNVDVNGDNKLDYKVFSGALYHNTFYGFTSRSIMADETSTGTGGDGNTSIQPTITAFKNNVIYQTAGIMLDGSNCGTLFTSADHNAWFGSATTDCITQSGAGDVTTDPQFTNPTANDLSLKNTSPLIDAGVDVPSVPETNLDVDGNQRDNSPDIGAYEFGGGAPPPSSSTCDSIFGGVSAYILCEETELTCKFNVTLGGSDCDTLCGSLGKVCVGAFDNTTAGCTEAGTDTCTTVRGDEICVCEIADAPPAPPEVHTYYVDASCGTNGNGTSTTCGANGPWNSLKYALETVDCAGMVAGDVLEIRGMTSPPDAGNQYSDSHTLYPVDGIKVDSSCSNIILRPYSGATEYPYIDGTLDFKSLTWTSIGSGVYESQATTLMQFPYRAFYKRGANDEEELSLLHSTRSCTVGLATDRMTYNAISKKICAHLSDGSSPAATTYFRVTATVNAFDFTTEDVDGFKIENIGAGTITIGRFSGTAIKLDSGINQEITIDGVDFEQLGENAIVADGGSSIANYNFSNNNIDYFGEAGIKVFGDLGQFTIVSNNIDHGGASPNFEKCNGIGGGCHTGYNVDPRSIWINNCAPDDGMPRGTIKYNVISGMGSGFDGYSRGIHIQDCAYSDIIDSNLIKDSTSANGFIGILETGIPSGQYIDDIIYRNNRFDQVDYAYVRDFDGATDQTGRAVFFYGNTCHNPNTTCVEQQNSPNNNSQVWFKDNLLDTNDGDGVLLLNIPVSNAWDSNLFANNGFQCNHANCSNVTIATFQGNNYKRDGDCTPSTDCIADINANNNIYGDFEVAETTLDIPATSDAVNAGVCLVFLPTDYKNPPTTRPFGGGCDIGAHENTGETLTYNLTQDSFQSCERFSNDCSKAIADVNKRASIYKRGQWNIRFSVYADAGGSTKTHQFVLSHQVCNPTCGSWTQVTTDCSNSTLCYVDDPNRNDGDPITNKLPLDNRIFNQEDSAFYDVAEDGIQATLTENEQVELEFSIGFCTFDRVCSSINIGDQVKLRLEEDGSALNTINEMPVITIEPLMGSIFGGGR